MVSTTGDDVNRELVSLKVAADELGVMPELLASMRFQGRIPSNLFQKEWNDRGNGFKLCVFRCDIPTIKEYMERNRPGNVVHKEQPVATAGITRDGEWVSFAEIAEILGISEVAVRRDYYTNRHLFKHVEVRKRARNGGFGASMNVFEKTQVIPIYESIVSKSTKDHKKFEYGTRVDPDISRRVMSIRAELLSMQDINQIFGLEKTDRFAMNVLYGEHRLAGKFPSDVKTQVVYRKAGNGALRKMNAITRNVLPLIVDNITKHPYLVRGPRTKDELVVENKRTVPEPKMPEPALVPVIPVEKNGGISAERKAAEILRDTALELLEGGHFEAAQIIAKKAKE